MIVADAKPLDEVWGFIEGYKKVLVLGCGECVTVCQVGGEKEVAVLAQQLRLKAQTEGKDVEFVENTSQRQCDPEFVDAILEGLDEDIDAIVSIACGVGVNFCSDRHPKVPVFPGVDTTFFGATIEHGVWAERCAGCGRCILDITGGICPIARCAKTILNGPCGGTNDGKCEISTPDNEVDCAWYLIVERCRELGTLEKLHTVLAPKDWTPSRDGGPRTRVREDLRIVQQEEAAAEA